MMYYVYGEVTTEGIAVSTELKNNLETLQAFVNILRSYNLKLIAMNEEGVVLDYMEPTIDHRLESLIDKVRNIESSVYSNQLDINQIHITLDNNNNKHSENDIDGSGEALYLLWDLLPDKLRKELQIYIKKL